MAKSSRLAAMVARHAVAAAESDPPADPTGAAKKEREPRKPKPGRKLTLHLSLELDFRLDSLARFNKQHKNAFALRLLEQGCRSYNADKNLKKVYAEISGQSGEDAIDSAA